jgi:hypothetical protein
MTHGRDDAVAGVGGLGLAGPASMGRRSASDTTPITLPSASRTGNAAACCSRSRTAISWNGASARTAAGSGVITSTTLTLIVLVSRQLLHFQLTVS